MTDFSFISLGCPKNTVDSEQLINQLQKKGFRLVSQNTSESVIILNTCSFIQKAVEETKEWIRKLIELKKRGNIQYLIVIGCFPSRFSIQDLEKEFPKIDLWLPIHQEASLSATMIQKYLVKSCGEINSKTNKTTLKLTPSHYAYLKISEGCNHFCSYCTIPFIRGRYQSKPLHKIIARAKQYAAMGVKELILVAEDTSIWGIDLYQKPSLDKLLTKLAEIPKVEWIRIMYAYPSTITNELIYTMKEIPKICAYLDMPIQHVNNKILKKMNRHYTKEKIIQLYKKLHQEIPDISLRTTLILGFPGETDAMIDELEEFIEQYPFELLGCFAYSNEPETKAFKLQNQCNAKTTEKRIARVMEKQTEILKKYNQKYVHTIIPAIYEGNSKARSNQDAPDIDRIIFLKNTKKVEVGKIYPIEITKLDGYDFLGKIDLKNIN